MLNDDGFKLCTYSFCSNCFVVRDFISDVTVSDSLSPLWVDFKNASIGGKSDCESLCLSAGDKLS